MMSENNEVNWHFTDNEGTFRLQNPQLTNHLYFPLVNEAGMMSVITPSLHGDIKTDQNSFFSEPLSVEDLHNKRSARNFWVYIDGYGAWSLTGNSAKQLAEHFSDDAEHVAVEAGLLWHTVLRENLHLGLKAEITNFVPASEDQVELMRVKLSNVGIRPVEITPTAAIPIFGRSADNLRDHRHVTSLLHRTTCTSHGILVRPTLSFDERGHIPNTTTYAVLGVAEHGNPPAGFFPVLESFIGEGGTLDHPKAIVKNEAPRAVEGDTEEGYEALGGLRFQNVTLHPGESHTWVILLAIIAQDRTPQSLIGKYASVERFEHWQALTQEFWHKKLDNLQVETGNHRFDGWMRWVTIQPILRRLFGNSFMPYHDYGRGGRGWRDLWQDILGLLLIQTDDVSETLWGHFAGVRIDGSNATIIGHNPGEFKADRNNIPRVWMDHGAWPLLTTRMYIDWTGDLDFLLREQTYFKDHFTHRSQKRDYTWLQQQSTQLKTTKGQPYQGSIFEHLLVQNLVPFFNVGEHNCILLEGADWNDALDMADGRGESVAFTAFYAGNLSELANLADLMVSSGDQDILIAQELTILLDTLFEPIPYGDPVSKREKLNAFFDSCAKTISGEKVSLSLEVLASDLRAKSEWIKGYLREQEWLEFGDHAWFNGYYDDRGQRIEGVFDETVQVTLAGQVFQLMSGVATDDQVGHVARSVDRYLYDSTLHGVRLNTRFEHHTDALGRVFGFAYGHKENGSMFSHMAVMYANALFKRGLHQQAHRILADMYQHCQDFAVSRMYPGLPEYLNPQGRGMYPYLTGSASWYLLTLVTREFGVRGHSGNLLIDPTLDVSRFDETGRASVQIPFAGRSLKIVFHNPLQFAPSKSRPARVVFNGQALQALRHANGLLIPRHIIQELPAEGWQQLDVFLEEMA